MGWETKYNKIPFADKGRDERGVDCWGGFRLIQLGERGINMPMYMDSYSSCDDIATVQAHIRETTKDWEPVELGKEKMFDAMVFLIMHEPMHVATVMEGGYMLHWQEGVGCVAEQYRRDKWMKRLFGIYRYAGEKQD